MHACAPDYTEERATSCDPSLVPAVPPSEFGVVSFIFVRCDTQVTPRYWGTSVRDIDAARSAGAARPHAPPWVPRQSH